MAAVMSIRWINYWVNKSAWDPPTEHTQTNTHTYTHPSPPCHITSVSNASFPCIRASRALKLPPSYQGTAPSWEPRGNMLRLGYTAQLSPCCPGASTLTPTAASKVNQSTYGNPHIVPDRDRQHSTECRCYKHICAHSHLKKKTALRWNKQMQKHRRLCLSIGSSWKTLYWCGGILRGADRMQRDGKHMTDETTWNT